MSILPETIAPTPAKHRRAHGEGSVYQRKDGRFAASLDLGWQNGKRVRKSWLGKTEREVKSKLNKALANLEEGIAPGDDRITVAAWVEQHLNDMEARKAAKHGTLLRYRGILANYLGPAIGRHRLAQLQPHHVRAYQTEMLAGGMAPSTITIHRAVLSGALGQAVEDGLITRNVVPIVKPPSDDSEPIGRAVPAEEARRFLEAAIDEPLRVGYLLGLTAGLRRGEMLGLSWQNIELAQDGPSLLHLRQQLQWEDGTNVLVPLKSKKSKRTIPIPSMVTRELWARRAAQESEFAAHGRVWQTSDLVLTSPVTCEFVDRNTFYRTFQALLDVAGVPQYRLHDLRHTYGSLLMSQGISLKTISDLMGHGSIDVTANVYLHSLEDQVLETAQAVARALNAPSDATPCAVCPACGQARQG